jgi:hypothetical protein
MKEGKQKTWPSLGHYIIFVWETERDGVDVFILPFTLVLVVYENVQNDMQE